MALIVTPILYQRLGEDQYGLVNLGLSVVMLLSILVNYGFHLNGPKRLALMIGASDKQSSLINDIILTRLLLSAILSIAIVLSVFSLQLFPSYGMILSLSLVVLIAEAFSPMLILQGLERLSLLALANALSKIFYLIAVVFVVTGPEKAIWVNFLFGGSSLIINLALLKYIYSSQSLRLRGLKLSRVRARLKENFDFFLSTIAGHVSVHGGFIILRNFVSDSELGRYALAQRVALLLRMIPVFLAQSILQKASRLYEKNDGGYAAYVRRAVRGGLVLTLSIGVGFSLTSDWVIRVVGGEFVGYSADILRMLAFVPFLSMLNIGNMIKILVAEKKEILAKATWLTAISMLVISIAGSYMYGGYGLAGALLIAELLSFVFHYTLLRAQRN